jgi:hypothetical protein
VCVLLTAGDATALDSGSGNVWLGWLIMCVRCGLGTALWGSCVWAVPSTAVTAAVYGEDADFGLLRLLEDGDGDGDF